MEILTSIVANFVRRKLKAGEIQKLRERLEEHQKTLDTRVLVDIRQTITVLSLQQSNRDTNLDLKLSELAKGLASCRISAADTLKTAIDEAIEADKREHEVTRTHIESHLESTVQAMTNNQTHQQELQKRRDQFLESLRFDDINVRGNEISHSSPRTFDWIFEDGMSKAWDSFSNWLQHGQNIYWINGKAGSGKSTLMKFIVKDERTSQALKTWAGGKDCMVLEFYFWLSGSRLQRSMKGFLCSLLRQVMSSNSEDIQDMLHKNELITSKQKIGDWSPHELRNVLQFAMESLSRTGNVCIFLDGLDEFDQDEDVHDLIELIEELTKFQNTKFCVSSRPDTYLEKRLSRYEQLRLQDLTAKDMQLYIRDTLRPVYAKYPPKSIKEGVIDKFIKLMGKKADGVFLWVHYALKSLLRGLRNEDDFEVLLMRLEELPSGMEQLYQQMWHRLNGDEQRYREEASTYFSFHESFPLPLFEMMVALNEDIRTKYLQDLAKQDTAEVAHKCDLLKTRILTRCAGLLEVAIVRYSDDDDDGAPPIGTGSDNLDFATSRSESMEGGIQNTESQKVVQDQVCSAIDGVLSPASTASNISSEVHSIASDNLQQFYEAKVKFMHRTARDFLLDTQAGHAIAGEASQSIEERFVNLMKASMASLLQGLNAFGQGSIADIIREVGDFETVYEIELLDKLHQVCKALSIPGSPSQNIMHSAFWYLGCSDLVGQAAYCGCVKYVRYFVEVENESVSPYYRGHLFLSLVYHLSSRTSKRLQLASWLAQNGADLSTKQLGMPLIETPFERLLKEAVYIEEMDDEMAMQIAQLIESIYSLGFRATDRYILGLREFVAGVRAPVLVHVEMGVSCLPRLAIYNLRRLGATTGSIRLAPSRSNEPLRVLTFKKSGAEGIMCPNHQDSVYLGKAYEKVLFPEDYPDEPAHTLKDYLTRVQEVLPRCEKGDIVTWEYQIGLRVDLPENALTLDPSEDIDETNWQEKGKGWVRTAATTTGERSASNGSA